MNRRVLHLALVFLALHGSLRAQGDRTVLIMGTHQRGSDLTEPMPRKSEYLETLHGGIVVIGNAAGFYLNTKVIKKPAKELYVVVEYENPNGGKPFVNDMRFKPTNEELHFSSPDFVRGLKRYSNYTITVRIFESKGAAKPLDTLKQTIRCYVDTRRDKLEGYEPPKPTTSP